MNENLTKLKENIISLGVTKTELQQLMDEIYSVQKLGNPCIQCSEATNIQHYVDEGFKIHMCPKCPHCILEFSFQVSSKKQKNSFGEDDGLHLRGKRASNIDEYLHFACSPFNTIELRSKDIANIKIPFYFPSTNGEKKSENDQVLTELSSKYVNLTNQIIELNSTIPLDGEEHFYTLDLPEIEYCGSSLRINVINVNRHSKFEDPNLQSFQENINLLEQQIDCLSEELKMLSSFEQCIFIAKSSKINNGVFFNFQDTILLNENTNIEYKLKCSELRNSKIINSCKSKFI